MHAVLLVKGVIQYGKLSAFTQALPEFIKYRRSRGWAIPEVLHAMSGPMNAVLMIFRYDGVSAWETECAAERRDAEYGRIASGLPYCTDSITYELYQGEG